MQNPFENLSVPEGAPVSMHLDMLRKMINFSDEATKVTTVLLAGLMENSDRIYLPFDRIALGSGLEDAQIEKGLVELLEAQVLAKAELDDFYWINPSMLYKGERVTFTA